MMVVFRIGLVLVPALTGVVGPHLVVPLDSAVMRLPLAVCLRPVPEYVRVET